MMIPQHRLGASLAFGAAGLHNRWVEQASFSTDAKLPAGVSLLPLASPTSLVQGCAKMQVYDDACAEADRERGAVKGKKMQNLPQAESSASPQLT